MPTNPEDTPPSAPELRFPVFETQPLPHWPSKMSWEAVTDETEPQRQHYMKHFDSPEKRLRDKNPAKFRL